MNIELSAAPVDVQFFGWALEHLPEASTLSGLLAVPNALPPEDGAERVRDLYRHYLYGSPFSLQKPFTSYDVGTIFAPSWMRYVDIVDPNFAAIKSAPDELYGADNYQPGSIDDLAYQAMLACFLGAFAADSWALSWLAVLLLRGPLNRQLTIGRFLGALTVGETGSLESGLPTKGQAVQWAQAAASGSVFVAQHRLTDVIRAYADFVSSSPSAF